MRRTPYIKRHEKRRDIVKKPTNIKKMVEVLDALQRHPGGLNTYYLFKIVYPKATDMADCRDLLKAMYTWDYISLPRRLNNPNEISSYSVYRLMPSKLDAKGEPTDAGRLLLKDAERLAPYTHPHSNSAIHDHMTALITASIEIEAGKAGYRFIPWYEVLELAPESTLHPKPMKSGRHATPFEIPMNFQAKWTSRGKEIAWHITTPTINDAIFGIDYKEKGKLYCTLETGMGSQDPRSPRVSKTTQVSKVLRSRHFVTSKLYQTHFGWPNCKQLYAFNSDAQVESMKEVVAENCILPFRLKGGPGATYIAIKEFDEDRAPKEIMSQLFTDDWHVVGMPAFNLSKP